MLQPKNRKFKKEHKGRVRQSGLWADLSQQGKWRGRFGDFCLYAKEGGRLTARQLEAGRRVIRRSLPREGKILVRVFPDLPVSAKPVGMRMGKGKGATAYWVSRIKVGQIIFEVQCDTAEVVVKALNSAAKKLPIATGFWARPIAL